MALLTEAERRQIFEELGLGEYNEAGILALQKRYLLRKSDWDGIYGTNTDNLLRHLKAVKDNCINFIPEEFRCGCNGRFCCGYPTYMKPAELANIQSIRTHFRKPMSVTCGVRCTKYNREVGGIRESEHLKGLAVDYYIEGITDTLKNRKASIKWIKTLPNHHYTYGDGINSNGAYVDAPGMGNCMHTDSYDAAPGPAPTPTPPGKLVEDGIGGPATVEAMQRFFGTQVDGVISGQVKAQKYHYPALTAVKFNRVKSTCIMKLQEWVGIPADQRDGILGRDTCLAWQGKLISLGYDIGRWGADGIFGTESMRAWQKFLNGNEPTPPAPEPTDHYLMIDVSEFQSSIDFAKVKADGIKAVIVRCGGRGGGSGKIYEDIKFMEYIKGAHNAGLPVGIYFLTAAINAEEGKAEAEYTISQWKKAGVPISYPICIDTENITWKEGGKTCYGRANDTVLPTEKRTEAVKAFGEECKRQGYSSMIYASTAWLNHQLDMSQLSFMDVWCAQYYKECQYKGKYIIWQYTSEGKVNGVKGGANDDVDMDKCYVDPKPVDPPSPEPSPSHYDGELPSLRLVKTTDQVIADAQIFGRWIAGDNRFGYGRDGGKKYKGTKAYEITHSGGCHFCGTNASKISRARKAGLKNPEEWEYTYVCNTFAHACYAHAGVMAMLKAAKHAWWISEYQKSKDWMEIKKPSKLSSLKPGDILASDTHFCVYLGNGKGMEATSGPGNGNPASSKEAWAKSIRICDFASHFKKATNIFRYVGSVDSIAPIRYGEVSDRVALMQRFLIWKGLLPSGSDDRIFGDNTLGALKAFQSLVGITVDGIAGADTIAKMTEIAR